MDFITGLPKSHVMSVILVVISRLTKYAHFIALGHPFSAAKVVELFNNGEIAWIARGNNFR